MKNMDVVSGCLRGIASVSYDGVMTVTLTAPEWCAGAMYAGPCFDEVPEEKATVMLERIAQDCLVIQRNKQAFLDRETEYNRRWKLLTNDAVDLMKSVQVVRCCSNTCAMSVTDSMRLKRQLNRLHRAISLQRSHLAHKLADGLGLSLPITNLAPVINKICGTNLLYNIKYQIW